MSMAAIGAVLQQEAGRQAGGRAVRLIGPLIKRDNSRIYRAQGVDDATIDAAVKLCRLPGRAAPDPSDAKEQYQALRSVDAALRARGMAGMVPTPLWLSVELGAYAMSWVEGESLSRCIAKPMAPAELEHAFEAMGAWLGHFHCSGPLRQGLVDLSSKLSYLEDLHGRPVQHALYAAGLARLSADADAAGRTVASLSWLHGDCKTDNFLLSPRGICCIDISLRFENAIEHDLAQFLNHADLLLSEWPHRRLRRFRTRLLAAFLRGYADTGPALRPMLLQWLRLWAALAAWYARLVERPQPWYQGWRTQQRYAGLVRHIMEIGDPEAQA